MIASERTQNAIVVTVIIVAIVSSGFLVSNASYYGGSYSLARTLNVTLLEVKVSNINHTSESIIPVIELTFNLVTSSLTEGNVRIIFMGATVWLNEDLLSYTSFSYIPPVAEQYLYPEFNTNYTMQNLATDSDKQTILDADTSGTWNWDIEFRYAFIVFDEFGTRTSVRISFNTTMTTFV